MKTIEVDEELYRYIAGHTHHIGESASAILRRLLNMNETMEKQVQPVSKKEKATSGGSGVTGGQIAELKALLSNPEYLWQKRVVNRFLQLLSVLYRVDTTRFSAVADVLQGRSRLYFATDRQKLLQHGEKSNPQQVPDTPYWVITNTNAARKRYIIEKMMLRMGFPVELIQQVCGTIHTKQLSKKQV